MKGRKPKPTALKLVTGNPGKRALNTAEPKPAADAIEPPPTLSPVARQYWEQMIDVLKSAGMVTNVDVIALGLLCETQARYHEATEALARHGLAVKSPTGYPIQSPYLAIANRAQEQIIQLLTEFGMTPSSRARVGGRPPPPADDAWDL